MVLGLRDVVSRPSGELPRLGKTIYYESDGQAFQDLQATCRKSLEDLVKARRHA